MYTRGDPEKHGIIFWRLGPLYYRLPLLSECSRTPSVSVYQLALLWESAFSFSECFFEESFNTFAHFMMGELQVHLPMLCWVSSSFLSKTWPPCSTLPIHLISPQVTYFIFLDEKSPQSKAFYRCGRGEQKTAEALKGIKVDKFKNCFEQ